MAKAYQQLLNDAHESIVAQIKIADNSIINIAGHLSTNVTAGYAINCTFKFKINEEEIVDTVELCQRHTFKHLTFLEKSKLINTKITQKIAEKISLLFNIEIIDNV